MDFQEEKYAKGATGYDQRIRNTFPFYETIHPTMNAMLRGLVRSDGQLLIVGAGTGAEILELHGANHYVFYSHPAQVTEAMRKFLGEAAGQ